MTPLRAAQKTEAAALAAQQAAEAAAAAQAVQQAAEQVAATQRASEAVSVQVSTPVDHTTWMADAGIDPSDDAYVETLIEEESSWNPESVNPSSGACGLVQALPCSKLGPGWSDPVGALTWGQQYVIDRYGSWANAMAFHNANGWY